jgi:integrase/recombinase XerC
MIKTHYGDRLPDSPLFCTVDRATFGHRLSGNAIYNIVRNSSKLAGITKLMSPHRIRHSAITAALDATNEDTRKVQKLSRHKNLNTLMIYDDNRHQHQSEVTGILADLV